MPEEAEELSEEAKRPILATWRNKGVKKNRGTRRSREGHWIRPRGGNFDVNQTWLRHKGRIKPEGNGKLMASQFSSDSLEVESIISEVTAFWDSIASSRKLLDHAERFRESHPHHVFPLYGTASYRSRST